MSALFAAWYQCPEVHLMRWFSEAMADVASQMHERHRNDRLTSYRWDRVARRATCSNATGRGLHIDVTNCDLDNFHASDVAPKTRALARLIGRSRGANEALRTKPVVISDYRPGPEELSPRWELGEWAIQLSHELYPILYKTC